MTRLRKDGKIDGRSRAARGELAKAATTAARLASLRRRRTEKAAREIAPQLAAELRLLLLDVPQDRHWYAKTQRARELLRAIDLAGEVAP